MMCTFQMLRRAPPSVLCGTFTVLLHDIKESLYVFYVYGSVHHNIFYEIPTDAALCSQFYSTARFTLHVSGVLYTHHQEYNF